MRNINFKKEKISIEAIGKKRFWFGIISGFFSAVIIALTFNRTRELIRYFSSRFQDILIFETNELIFFNYFFVSLSTVLGLSITIWIWMGNPLNKNRKQKLYKQQTRVNSQLFFWLILFLSAQLCNLFIYLSIAEVNSYDFPVNLFNEYKLLFILSPIVIFGQNWFHVRLIYKTGNWILISFIISLFTTLCLYKTTTTDHNILNHIYFAQHKKYFKYIEEIISKSKKEYNITFNYTALKTLKQQKSYNSKIQVQKIKEAFSKDKKLSLDTIIIQKVIIHNLKGNSEYRYNYDLRTLYNWKYALPKDIFKQIQFFDTNSNEIKELFQVLKEEIILVNKAKIILENQNDNDFNYRSFAKDKKQLKVNVMVVEQLIEVTNKIKQLKKYSTLSIILPDIKTSPNNMYN
ncbi:hypothetical protein ACOSP6_00405 [Tenacibaculum sp. MEBiC06402]|uniref:hypothetical protein n=1 Tax=unclassified Tenacibaculum TaxID=2635139 RepID=UPI003B9B64FC